MKSLLPFIKLFKQQLWWLVLGVMLSFITILASIGLLTLSGWFISAAASASLSYAAASQFNFFLPAAGVRFFSLSRILGRYGERLATHEATFKILTDMRVWFYKKLEPLAPAHLMRFRSGDLLSRIVNDINALDNLYIRVMAPSIVVLLVAIFIGVFYSFFDKDIALFSVVMILVTAFIIPLCVMLLAKKTGNAITETSADLKSEVVEHIQGLAELKLFSADETHLEKVDMENVKLLQQQQKMSMYTGVGAALMSLAMGVTLLGVTWLAVKAVSSGQLSGAMIALLALGVMAFFEAIAPLPVAYQYLGKTVSAAKRLLHITNAKPEVSFEQDKIVALAHYDIEYKKVTFGYEVKQKVFHDYDVVIKEGERAAVTGHTGSGKSTFIHLLARIWDCQQGDITIGGENIKHFSEEQLRQLMTVVAQRPHIFNASIRENLQLAKPEATIKEMMHALEVVELKAFVESLPEGLETWTGEQGQALSGGQQKRLALARAVLRDAPILILDEPTEGLDSITEAKTIQALEKVMMGKTVILVTHNEQLAKRMNRVIGF
ncbi:cysteine/glutathione ABC transporter ATP-binding protein/permease CydC [Francisellaceae bacterium]|nr:cysteine/glutathione ABC transporter ATP-binding protein/permease CydC [Francisellaceae bacterium]